jgi:hypothetical protein
VQTDDYIPIENDDRFDYKISIKCNIKEEKKRKDNLRANKWYKNKIRTDYDSSNQRTQG